MKSGWRCLLDLQDELLFGDVSDQSREYRGRTGLDLSEGELLRFAIGSFRIWLIFIACWVKEGYYIAFKILAFLDFSKNSEALMRFSRTMLLALNLYKTLRLFKPEGVGRKLGIWKFREMEFEKARLTRCGLGRDITIPHRCHGDNCPPEGSRNAGKLFMIWFLFSVIRGAGK